MKSLTLPLVLTAALLFASGAQADDVNVALYSSFATTSGGGAPYSGFVANITVPDVMFGTDTGFNWHPLGLASFGADITGDLLIPSAGSYTFALESDDGSLLFIDGSLVVNHGGPSAILDQITGTAALSVGVHPFEIQFFECCGGDSGVDLTLASGVSYTSPSAAPEPRAFVLVLIGAGLFGIWRGTSRTRHCLHSFAGWR